MSTYSKPAINLSAQVAKLKSRGLEIQDDAAAENCLLNVGYYRFSGYSYPFKDGPTRERFKPNTGFDQILRVYEFDRHLRLLVADAIERIEVGIRSRIVNETSLLWGPHGYLDSSNFHRRFNHAGFIQKAENGVTVRRNLPTGTPRLPRDHAETFIDHYYIKYGDPYLPPIWMTMEVLTLGTLSKFYMGIGDANLKAKIAGEFNVTAKVFANWLHSLSHIRNICAHHGRLWNRAFSITPLIPAHLNGVIQNANRFEGHAVVLVTLLNIMNHGNHWRNRLKSLLSDFPEMDPRAMGFTNNCLELPVWNT
ncbi:Abi family protein [Coraliomargarita sp. SDUM461004]|uniref:Abi family protein n=1 Tax=Thalassobacterium sedimentorum TaxID=3041258 RepID=A0ABU1ARK5_9BACT|nr:Abi family protein [Coraliomargarita sp. SDUM461004]MDQ8196238.1 Abi family protein [Coraliomargarita sp. SDUM461004]